MYFTNLPTNFREFQVEVRHNIGFPARLSEGVGLARFRASDTRTRDHAIGIVFLGDNAKAKVENTFSRPSTSSTFPPACARANLLHELRVYNTICAFTANIYDPICPRSR